MIDQLGAENRSWGLSRMQAGGLLVLPIVVLAGYALLYVAARDALRVVADEDGLIEWLQALLFMITAIAGGATALVLARRRSWVWAGLFTIMALGALFVTGEELAWGQRILDFATPESLREINEKDEVSLHNITTVERYFILGKLAVGLVAGLGPWLWLATGRSRSGFFPPCALSMVFLAGLLVRSVRYVTGTIPLGSSEIEELLIALGLALFALLAWLRARRGADLADASDE